MMDPKQCQTLAEVRSCLDELDAAIVELLAKRFDFIDAVVRLKQSPEQVRDEARNAEVIARARRVARELGAPEEAIGGIFGNLVETSIAYQLAKFEPPR